MTVMGRSRWWSFRVKTIVGIALIELLLLGLLIWSSLRFLSDARVEALAERAADTAEQFAILAQDAVLSEDLASLDTFADGVIEDLDLVYLRVIGYRDPLIERGDPLVLERPFVADAPERVPEDGVFDAGADVVVGDMVFGRVEVGIDAAEGSALIHTAREWLLTIALAEVVLVALFSFLLGTYLTRALEHLRDAADAITSGQVGVQVPVEGEDEVAATTRAFNRMSERLKASYDALEQARQAAEQAAAEAKAASNEAQRANAAKSRFLAHMSHELRTPLNAVIGILQLSEDWTLPDEQHEQLRIAKQAGHSLLELINNVLDLSKIEAGELRLDEVPTQLRALLESAADIVRPLIQVKGVQLVLELGEQLPTTVSVDGVRLRQVLINLMGNAGKFTDSGEVRLRVSSLCPGQGCQRFRFEVSDTGVGIDPARQKTLFQEFSQIASTDGAQRGGTGLGLSISQRIVNLMGGEIRIDSRLGEGSRFWFEVTLQTVTGALPGSAGASSPAREAPACTISEHQSRAILPVLLVDDVPTNRLIAGAMLKKAGYQVQTASNGAEAIEAICGGPVGCVLMDVDMPVLNGIDATKRIRALSEPISRVPIIAMTAHAFAEERQRCQEAGMDAFVTKPLPRDQLLAVVAEWHGKLKV
jgi:signal transduction histidine kinase/ActR/RegA family two-component response regulator